MLKRVVYFCDISDDIMSAAMNITRKLLPAFQSFLKCTEYNLKIESFKCIINALWE